MKSFLKNIGKNVVRGGKAVAGGAAARVVTNKVVPMIPLVKDYPKLAGVPAFLLGVALMDNKSMEDIGVGMAAVAGTDTLGKFVPMVSASGISDDVLDVLSDAVADELENSIEDDVSNEQAAMSDDTDDMSDEVWNEQAAMSDDVDDYINDDESAPVEAMNSI